jgi:hypothetical protein
MANRNWERERAEEALEDEALEQLYLAEDIFKFAARACWRAKCLRARRCMKRFKCHDGAVRRDNHTAAKAVIAARKAERARSWVRRRLEDES